MHFIDTHTHLYLDHFKDDFQDVIKRATEAGVKQMLLPNIDVSTVDSMHDICRQFPDLFVPMMGLHPCSVKSDFLDQLKSLEAELDQGGYCAVGEIGIDLYWDKSTLEIQVEAFNRQIDWALERSLPIVIHARESFDEIFEVVNNRNCPELRGVFHCFTGSVEQARHIIGYGGFMLGIGGVATYKNGGLDKVLPEIGLEHLLLETDAPYLTPVPFRGKRNESAYLRYVADQISSILDVSVQEVAETTSNNAVRMFGLN